LERIGSRRAGKRLHWIRKRRSICGRASSRAPKASLDLRQNEQPRAESELKAAIGPLSHLNQIADRKRLLPDGSRQFDLIASCQL